MSLGLGMSFLAALRARGVGARPAGGGPLNPELGVPGFPDCVRRTPAAALSIDGASHDLVCKQRRAASADTVRIACVGDSITAGVCSTGGNATYPAQLQLMLDAAHGPGAYSVTNLGACGSTMLKGGDSPYWERPQFDAFVNATWDVVIVMLGTNDAKDPGDGGPDNWQHDCGGASHTTLDGCQYASDYADMIALTRTLGRDAQTPPRVFVNAPPPLMMSGAIGANQMVIAGLPAARPAHRGGERRPRDRRLRRDGRRRRLGGRVPGQVRARQRPRRARGGATSRAATSAIRTTTATCSSPRPSWRGSASEEGRRVATRNRRQCATGSP